MKTTTDSLPLVVVEQAQREQQQQEEEQQTSPPIYKVSPTAKAFFDALDGGGGDPKKKKNNNGRRRISNSLLRKSQSLGWRNRYSQNEYYPITIETTMTDMKTTTTTQTAKSTDTSIDAKDKSSTKTTNPINFTVKQIQRGEIENTYGTGATVWPAAMVLLKYLEYHASDIVQGKRIVDLGTGTGITSIGCAILGASSVICTDGENSVVTLAKENVIHVASSSKTEISGRLRSIPTRNP